MGDKGDYFVDEVYDRPDKVVIGTSGREVVKQDPTERVVVGQECPPADPLTFENIMGQEDFFRQESGTRVDNRGTARIVITTPGNAEVKRIEYDVNPVDEDNPVFNETWTIDSSGGTHEVFRPIVPDALYAFQVIITQPGEGEKTSGIYYFNTSTEVDVDPVTLDVEVFVSIETIDKSTSVEVSQLDGLAPQTVKDGGTGSLGNEAVTASTTTVGTSHLLEMSMFTTLVSTSVT